MFFGPVQLQKCELRKGFAEAASSTKEYEHAAGTCA